MVAARAARADRSARRPGDRLALTRSFVVALLVLAAWSFVSAVQDPLRRAFINGLIPSGQRATVLSFDSLMGSAGGVVAQPALGRVADLNGHGPAYLVSAAISVLALPFTLLARREHASSDPITGEDDPPDATGGLTGRPAADHTGGVAC